MARDLLYEKELRVKASPETLFELLTDPEEYRSWMGFGARLEPRPGGAFELDLGPEAQVRGEFREVVPGRKVSMTWGWEGAVIPLGPGQTLVEFTLIPDGDHTILRFRHSGLSPALRDFHAWGWDRYLPRLAAVAERRDPGPDPMQPGPPLEQLRRLLEREGKA